MSTRALALPCPAHLEVETRPDCDPFPSSQNAKFPSEALASPQQFPKLCKGFWRSCAGAREIGVFSEAAAGAADTQHEVLVKLQEGLKSDPPPPLILVLIQTYACMVLNFPSMRRRSQNWSTRESCSGCC